MTQVTDEELRLLVLGYEIELKQARAENEKIAQRIKGLELRIEGKNGILTAYRLGRQPSQAAFDKLGRANEILGDEV